MSVDAPGVFLGRLAGGGSTKSPLGNGKRMKTVKLVLTGILKSRVDDMMLKARSLRTPVQAH